MQVISPSVDDSRRRGRDVACFVALFTAAILLGPALAHAFELPAKMRLSREDYLVVQQIYAGWNRLGFLIPVELTGVIAACVVYWRERARPLFAGALIAIVLGQLIFWMFTFPMNQLTANWTALPDGWQVARRQWEYSHFAGAVCQTVAVALLIVAVLRRNDARPTAVVRPRTP